MKKIISITLFADPRTQGGIETFNRTLKKFYPKEWIMITNLINKPKIYKVSDVIEIGSTNIFFRVINKILKNKLREILTLKRVKKELEKVVVFSFPQETYFLRKIKAKKILVQHINCEKYISSYCENKEEYIESIKNNVDYFVVLSDYDGERFIKELNYDRNKIKVIRHSCDMPLLKNEKQKNKKLIMVGRIDNTQKRFDLAIKAMKKLPDFTLDIYGDIYSQKDMNYLQELMKKENIVNVIFKGGTNKVQEKLDESGIFIMTSDYEGYPITLIEAMRRGLPIVLRNTFDSAPDIIKGNGVLLEKEWNEDKVIEAIKIIYNNYDYYSENSRRLGERHSPEVIKREWDKLLVED